MKPSPPSAFPRGWPRRRDGVALVIILAFVVIITGVILAFFSRAIWNRSISNASASQTKVDLLAEGATDEIIGDLQQEIVMSSSATTVTTGSTTIYLPLTPASMLPQVSGTTASVPGVPPNLLKRSAYDYSKSVSVPFYVGTNGSASTAGTIVGGAINVSSTTPSLNGRSVSLARWNSHYLLPLLSSTDSTPVNTGAAAFTPPDWILISRNGQPATGWNLNLVSSSTNSTSVIGRYAYAIYHEGGLLDANVAGYPMGSSSPPATGTNQYAYKPALSYADLTQIGLTQAQVDQLVAWRNYASALVTGSFQSPTYTQASGSNYYASVLNNVSGFINVSGTGLNPGTGILGSSGQSDRMFASRQELIAFMQKGLGLSGTALNALNYLATFTRGINQPSIAPDPTRPKILATNSGGNNAYGLDNQINPSFLAIRVASPGFSRFDGSTAVAGEPLVKKRFALSKLAWLTYQGPSANRNTTNPSASGSDADIYTLESNYNISPAYLQQGTAANIQNYFGLVWQQDKPTTTGSGNAGFHDNTYKWFYQGHNAVNQPQGAISKLGDIAAAASARDPDFFELLKAAILAGSKAKQAINLNPASPAMSGTTAVNPADPIVVQTLRDQSLDYAIIQLGANIINQAACDGYSTRIVFNDGTGAHEFRGVINQPYLYRVGTGCMKLRTEVCSGSGSALSSGTFSGPLEVPSTSITSGTTYIQDTGVGMIMQSPTIWNPHDINAPIGSPAPQKFRMVVDSCLPENQDNGSNNYSSGYLDIAATGMDGSTHFNSTGATANTKYCPAFSYKPYGAGTLISTLVNSSNLSPIVSASNYLTFTITNPALFREPTLLIRPNLPAGSNLALNAIGTDYVNVTNSNSQQCYQNGGFTAESGSPAHLPSADITGSTSYIGIPIGLYPIAWDNENSKVAPPSENYFRAYYAPPSGALPDVTYRLQYQDQNNNWITYDEKYVRTDWLFPRSPLDSLSANATDDGGNLLNQLNKNGGCGGTWESFLDPRTARFSPMVGDNAGPQGNTPAATTASVEWLDPVNNVAFTARPDVNSGYGMSNRTQVGPPYRQSSYMDVGWALNASQDYFLRQGLFAQNSRNIVDNGLRTTPLGEAPVNAGASQYYADPDGVVRSAMGAYVTGNSSAPAVTTIGLPLATAANTAYQNQSRPYMLHRPFHSVAELGYVFSGTPWKNLDFFTPQSGDSALLDLFTAYETPVVPANQNPLVAGVVDLNTRQAPVLQALLSGAYVDDATTTGVSTANPQYPSLTGAQAALLVTSGSNPLPARTASTAAGQGPLENLGDLVGRWYPALVSGTYLDTGYSGASADLTSAYAQAFASSSSTVIQSMQNIQRFREALIRPLVAAGNTRVWNLMIDLVAQTGRYPAATTNPASFIVEGEQRYWVHIAVDRFTGQVLDKQIEVVKE